MVTDTREWLSTGQAAKFCSVKRDTILKWIKRGKLLAERTAGGHYRIQRQELEPLILTPRRASPLPGPEHLSGRNLRCWEYMGGSGTTRDDCRHCIVYRSRAAWCFQMADLAREVGHARLFCQETCESCSYYRRVRGMATGVLVITPDADLRTRMARQSRDDLRLRFAEDGYRAATIISEFKPAFVVLDHDLMKGVGARLLDHLTGDERIPGIRVVIAVTKGKGARIRAAIDSESVVGVIEKPFDVDQIASVVGAFPVEVGVPDEGAPI